MASMSLSTRALVGTGLLTIGPFVVVIGLVFLEHLSPWHSQFAELFFVVVGVGVGIIGVLVLPIKRLVRGALIVPYAAATVVATWVSLLPFVCAYFGDCL
jgi:uncharacterized membrane protein YgaE (UPF0421/DUF939 family)